MPAIRQYRPSDLYLTDRKETMAILKKYTHTPLHICKLGPLIMLMFVERTGILLVRMKTNDKKIFGRWFEVMTAGIADKMALYWYAEPSVLTHRSCCGDYTCTHAHELHARNTHTNTCTHACTQHSHVHT